MLPYIVNRLCGKPKLDSSNILNSICIREPNQQLMPYSSVALQNPRQ